MYGSSRSAKGIRSDLDMLVCCSDRPIEWRVTPAMPLQVSYRYNGVDLDPDQDIPPPAVPLQVSYRYNVVRARLSLMQARLADVNSLVGAGMRVGSR